MNGIRIPRSPAGAVGELVIGLIACAIMLVTPAAQAQDDTAETILKAMSDYVATQKSLAVTFDTDIEVITPDIQKIQFASSSMVLLSRPNKLRASRTGGYVDVELLFDGQTLTVLDKETRSTPRWRCPGPSISFVDRLRDQYAVDMPGADLMLPNAYDAMMEEVLDAKYIGHGVIDGVECDHLAFRNQDTDWQIWINAASVQSRENMSSPARRWRLHRNTPS